MKEISLPEGYSYDKGKKVGAVDYVFVYKNGKIILAVPAKYCPDERIIEVAQQTANF